MLIDGVWCLYSIIEQKNNFYSLIVKNQKLWFFSIFSNMLLNIDIMSNAIFYSVKPA